MKMIKKTQTGVGLVEVMIALLLLGVAVLGFIALQVRAISASEEAGQNVQAMNLARDLSERMRMNREGLLSYEPPSTTPAACDEARYCSPADMAHFEYGQVEERAAQQGMTINVLDCQGVNNTFRRKCIYVAWGKTEANDASDTSSSSDASSDESTACTNGTSYEPNAQCVIMEVYNYE
ncbi:type IV pilus modification protein PilV [Acinetobacter johnsonii ANC 3681]|uniref:Type IV pilus modification protein PilV n=1 Tax=Acinetobacter johnsonii ANC 3681 TaxID=1217662 RepID=N9D0W3_ACIJO|nr:type IV pilus modification protein PilV [Acinetobacter johnsonii ANC 3681]